MEQLFITGTYRSGTTVVEKLVHSLPSVAVASQPLPVLYIRAKQRFLASLGHEQPHPLSHLFLEDRYDPGALSRFLDRWRLSREDVDQLLLDLRKSPGFWSPSLLGVAERIPAGTFDEVRAAVVRLLAEVQGKPDAQWAGSKEVLCEEFVPHLLERGERVVIVIRDPRDILRSVYFGRGAEFAGRVRPILYHLRSWRKSVAYALALRDHPAFAAVRYEDVLLDASAWVNELSRRWRLGSRADVDLGRLHDQDGRVWEGNSSFAGQQNEPRPELPEDIIGYVDTLCRPELLAMGYPCGGARDSVWSASDIDELVPPDDPALDARYSTDPDNLAREEERLGMLHRRLTPSDARRWFIHEGARAQLSEAIKGD